VPSTWPSRRSDRTAQRERRRASGCLGARRVGVDGRDGVRDGLGDGEDRTSTFPLPRNRTRISNRTWPPTTSRCRHDAEYGNGDGMASRGRRTPGPFVKLMIWRSSSSTRYVGGNRVHGGGIASVSSTVSTRRLIPSGTFDPCGSPFRRASRELLKIVIVVWSRPVDTARMNLKAFLRPQPAGGGAPHIGGSGGRPPGPALSG
jgi:hypothetical protein